MASKSCFLTSFVEFRSAVAEKIEISKPIKSHSRHLGFLIGPKTHMVEDVDFVLPDKIRQILFNGFRDEVDKYEKLTTDRRWTTHYHKCAFEPSAHVHLNEIFVFVVFFSC